MLSILRKQAGSWIIKIILLAIVVVFILWGVGSFQSREANKVADVNGEIVSYEAYREAYDRMREQYRRAYGDALNEEMLKSMRLNDQALNQIVNRILMLQEAQRLNIQMAEKALDEAIFQIPAFQNNGVFNKEQAKFVLSQNNMTTADFRKSYREDLILDKLRALVVDGVSTSAVEAREWYDWYGAEVDLAYLLFPAERYQDLSVTEEEITDHFKANEKEYLTDPQVKVSYLFFDPNTFKAQVNITKEQVGEYYTSHIDEFKTEKTVEARHILLKLDEKADAKSVDEKQQEAMKIYKLAMEGKLFADLAKQYSDDPNKESGGNLGAFKKDAMVEPFAEKAFSMKAGEISEPVRTRFGWHIIKVEKVNEAQTVNLEAATDRILKMMTEEKARELALKKAETIYDTLFDGEELAKAGQAHQLAVQTTEFFTSKGLKEKRIGNTQRFADKAFALEKMAISDVLDLENGFYLLQVVDRLEASIPSLEAVKEKVRTDLMQKRRNERAKADAEACLAEVQKGKSLIDAGVSFDLRPMETGFFKRSGTIPKIGYDPQIGAAAFALQSGKTIPDKVFQGREGWYVIQLRERKPPAADEFAKEQDSIVNRLTEQKKQSALGQWLADLKARGKVDINSKLIQ
ncbi:MAG: SurA N-terminal domain-containing protein [Desulfatitalea sp.]